MDVKGLVRLGECNDVIVIGSITLNPKVVVRPNRPQTQIARRDRGDTQSASGFRALWELCPAATLLRLVVGIVALAARFRHIASRVWDYDCPWSCIRGGPHI